MEIDERAKKVINNLSSLIISHGNALASERFSPRHNPDESDDYIKEQKLFVSNLRKIREEFENVILGIQKLE